MARKIIIDTDPGVDDILAILLACSALPEEIELLLISVTYGNVDVQNCLRNVVSLFYHVEQEMAWRKINGRALGFEALLNSRPLVAVGPEHPLSDQLLMADFFHGRDGLGGIHKTHPHMTPTETWKAMFQQAEKSQDPEEHALAEEDNKPGALFTPSKVHASQEILRLLRENEGDSITIVAIGPLTNLALAAAEDPETFLRAKEIVVMGGNIDEVGNITPVAEFNTFADSFAAARLYALSSPDPRSTMPPSPPAPPGEQPHSPPPPYLASYPDKLSRRLKITLFPLDITHRHNLNRGDFRKVLDPLLEQKSPLAAWVNAFMSSTFHKVEFLQQNVSGDAVALQLHDPLCVWYCMALDPSQWKLIEDEDLRVESSGQWTRGMCVIDRRSRKKREDDHDGEIPGDTGNWLSAKNGNRLRRCIASPGEDLFARFMLERIFAL
ncbi:hypothetical protein DOTSEDRAFT_68360 [Dothistroma septosporum NZE10]|uniref:Inosine/uridine-preferring nucleoside hydrolase domain-containing protein n=1 Tax=Dothistroma septosporum (strain NZE10 / CBS 128990) TaxID=675120 RepID=N1Q1D9_DOTSN|nr:hypothetical protein DOTSEDRAFT_68360 [Dothistroma septosporum NZE10]